MVKIVEGSVHPHFYPLVGTLQSIVSRYGGGAAVCVYQHGECVVDIWAGVRDEEGTPWTRDTMAPSFSTTKGVASTLLHMMVDRGLLDYDDRVAEHWPEFAQAGKENITVRQVLAHQSGLYHIRQMIDHADRMLDWAHMIRAIERTASDPRARDAHRLPRAHLRLHRRRDPAAGHRQVVLAAGEGGDRRAARARRHVRRRAARGPVARGAS